MSPDAILETALYADDLEAAAEFYGGLFGLEEVARAPGRHVFFGCGPGMLLIFDAAATGAPGSGAALPVPPHGARGPGHMCFRVEASALADWAARLRARGVAIEADFEWPNGARSIYLRDPAGNSIEISERKLWGRPE